MADPASLPVPLEITTQRLVVRCPSEDDGLAVNASVRESLDELRRFGGSLHHIDWRVPKCEVGWWGRSSMLGRGLITDGVYAAIR